MSQRVSILMACYNGERTLERAIRSVQGQTHEDWELLVVDDCSTDNSRAVVDQFKDNRIRLFTLSKNSGPSAARNRAIYHATGKWLTVLDADDAFEPNRLTVLVKAANTHRLDMVFDQLIYMKNETPTGKSQDLREGIHLVTLRDLVESEAPRSPFPMGYLQPLVSSMLVAQGKVRYLESVRTSEDFGFNVECALASARIGQLDYAGYFYSFDPKAGRVFDPTPRQTVGRYLLDKYRTRARRGDVAMLRKYLTWQERFGRFERLSEAKNSLRIDRALRVLLEDPGLAIEFAKGSRLGRVLPRAGACNVPRRDFWQ